MRSGLHEGDTVLQFVPGKEQAEDDESADGGSVMVG